MKTRMHLILSAVLLSASLAQGDVSSPQVRRRQLDEGIAATTVPDVQVDQRVARLRDPFYMDEPAVPDMTPAGQAVRRGAASAARSDDAANTEAPRAPTRSDADALTLIARSFQPTGSMILGERRFVTLPDGRPMPQGATFVARIEGEEYTVEITQVTTSGYVLKLRDTLLHRSFNEARTAP